MKKLILLILLIPSMAFADYLVCDPQSGVTKYRIDGTIIVDAEADGSIKLDISTWGTGVLNKTIEAGAEYVLDGVPQGVYKWSTAVPFELNVPGNPVATSGIKVID